MLRITRMSVVPMILWQEIIKCIYLLNPIKMNIIIKTIILYLKQITKSKIMIKNSSLLKINICKITINKLT